MTTEVQVRDALVGYIDTAWKDTYPSVEVFYENTIKINLDSVGSVFLRVVIEFVDSMRQGIDPVPNTRRYGNVLLQVFCRDGQGTRDALSKIGYLRDLLKYRDVGGATLDCPRVRGSKTNNGWTGQELIVPFTYWQ